MQLFCFIFAAQLKKSLRCVMFLENFTMTSDQNLDVISPFVHVAEAVKLTNCPRSTLIKYSELGLFVPMVRLLGNRIAFIRSDVLAWVESRVASAKGVA
jgi:predicted DNA-binding transcriptional regulator AlpA